MNTSTIARVAMSAAVPTFIAAACYAILAAFDVVSWSGIWGVVIAGILYAVYMFFRIRRNVAKH